MVGSGALILTGMEMSQPDGGGVGGPQTSGCVLSFLKIRSARVVMMQSGQNWRVGDGPVFEQLIVAARPYPTPKCACLGCNRTHGPLVCHVPQGPRPSPSWPRCGMHESVADNRRLNDRKEVLGLDRQRHVPSRRHRKSDADHRGLGAADGGAELSEPGSPTAMFVERTSRH